MNPLAVKIGKVELATPLMAASGTFGYGDELLGACDLNAYGAIVTKGITFKPRAGNKPPRIWETPAGMINAIGLQNVGVHRFVNEKVPKLKALGIRIVVNLAGESYEDYLAALEVLKQVEPDITAIELNVSCPNVAASCIAFGSRPELTFELVKQIRQNWQKPLWVKLTPNAGDRVPEIARAAEEAGADAIAHINTFLGLAINPDTRKPRLANTTGGVSGPAIKPMALYQVWKVASTVNIPVIGMGGIMTAEDVVEFFLAGASAVEIGTAQFFDAKIAEKINIGLLDYLQRHQITNIGELTGKMEIN